MQEGVKRRARVRGKLREGCEAGRRNGERRERCVGGGEGRMCGWYEGRCEGKICL